MDDNPDQQLMEKIEHCQEIASNLEEEYESLLQKQMQTDNTADSEPSVVTPLANDVTKQLKDIDLALESNQQQLKLALEKYLATQAALSTSEDGSTIQSGDKQMEVANVTINQQVKLLNDITDTNELMDLDLDVESIQQQVELTLQQSTFRTSFDRTMIQNDDNQQKAVIRLITQHVKLLNDNNGQTEAKLNPTVQALFAGTLPDDFYLHLLSVIGIQECLLSNRLVCSLWNDLILERCHNQKSLKVFETFDNLIEYGELLLKYEKTDDTSLILKSIGDDLLFEGLGIDHKELVKSLYQDGDDDDTDDDLDDTDDDEDDMEECKIQTEMPTREKKLEASKVLTALFPKVEELVLCPEFLKTLINMEHLLQFYAKQLTSLTMTSFDGLYGSLGSKLPDISFPLLKSLNTFYYSPEDEHLLSLLPQLESLTIESTQISLETLLRTGTQLRELNIKNIQSVYTAPEDAFSKRLPINNNLRKFSFVSTQNEVQLLELISQNLTSLEALKLDLILFPDDTVSHLHSLTPYLAPLTQLHSLTLEAPVSFFHLDDNQLAEIKPFPSVRQLKLLLWDYDSLPLESMDLFSRSLLTAFPKIEQVLIGFVGYEAKDADAAFDFVDDGLLYADTQTAFQDFAGKHPSVVQLFRSKDMSRFTAFPNAVSPLLGHHRQVYEEYLEEEELFGVAICQLAASLVTRQGEVRPNLKSALRPADRLTAMSNLFQLLENQAFGFTFEKANKMLRCMFGWALDYGPSQVALFRVTCKSVLFLLDCRLVDGTPFLYHEDCQVYSFFEMTLNLVEHYRTEQLDDKKMFLQLCKRMVKLLTVFDSIRDDEQFDDYNMFKVLLELADYYQTEQLNVIDNSEELLFHIHNLVDDQLEKFESEERLDSVTSELIRSENCVYTVEMARALTRCCKSSDSYFKRLSREVDSDSSDSDDSTTSDSSESDSSDSTISDASSSSAESEP